jgi:hypothetical protein
MNERAHSLRGDIDGVAQLLLGQARVVISIRKQVDLCCWSVFLRNMERFGMSIWKPVFAGCQVVKSKLGRDSKWQQEILQ